MTPIDWDAYDAQHTQTAATTNVAQGNGVPPQSAVDALQAAPVVGTPPEVGMHDPAPVVAQARAKTNVGVLDTSAPVRSFVASSPAKAAAISDDYGPLARVAKSASGLADSLTSDFITPFHDWFAKTSADLAQDVAPTGDMKQALFQGADLGRKISSIFTGTGGADVLNSLVSGGVNVAARPFSALPTGSQVFAKDAEGNDTGDPLRGPDGLPLYRAMPSDERYSQAKAAVNVLLGGASIVGVERALRPAVEDLGRATIVRQARLPGEPEVAPVDAEFSPIHPPGVDPTQSDAYRALADLDAAHVTHVQEELAATATHTRAPELGQDLLANHTEGVGDTTVGVPAEHIAALWDQGHEVFPDLVPLIRDALTSGADVRVPLAQYLAETAGKPFAEELNNVSSFREGGVSVEEAKGLGASPAEPDAASAPPPEPTLPPDIQRGELPKTLNADARSASEAVFKEMALSQLFADPKALGLTKAQMENYSDKLEEAQSALHDRLLQRTYDQIRHERTPDWRAAVELHTEAETARIEAQPNVKAYRTLRDPFFKLDADRVRDLYPELSLPKGVLRKGGLDPDEVGQLLGYDSGAKLAADLHHLQVGIEASGGDIGKYVKARARVYAEAQARADLGYDVTPEGLANAARELVVAPDIESVLTDQLRAIGEKYNFPVNRTQINADAAETFSRLPVSEARKPRAFAEQMRKLGNKAEQHIDSDPRRALTAKQQQLIQYLHMKEAFKFQKEFAKADRQLSSVARKPTAPNMDQTARNFLRAIAADLGVRTRTGKYEDIVSALKGQTLAQYGDALLGRGTPAYITDVPGEINTLNVGQFRDVMDMFDSLATLGRAEKTVEVAGQKMALDDLAAEVAANADATGRQFTSGEAQLAKGKVRALDLYKPEELQRLLHQVSVKTSAAMRALGAATTRMEVPFYWLDRETNGPLMKSIVNPLNDGSYYKAEKIKAISAAFKEFLAGQPKGWEKSLDARVSVPELTYGRDADGASVPWLRDRGNVIRAALHMGTEDNWANLLEGFGWDAATAERVIMREMSPADWKYVQFLWDQAHSLWPETQALYRDTVGLAPKEIVGRDLTVPGVGKLQGRYWHLDYDWDALGEQTDEDGNRVEVVDPMALGTSDLFGTQYRVSTPPNGSTKQRTQFRGPLNLDHSTLHREIEAVIHDLAFRRPLIQAAKVLRQPKVRAAIREALGPEYLMRANDWLKQIAGGASYDQTSLRKIANSLNGIRGRFTIYQIGYNLTTLAKHGGIAMMHMTGEGGAQLPGAVRDLMLNRDYWTDFVDQNSGEVRNTVMNLDRDVREVMEKSFQKRGFLGGYTYHATTLFGMVKRVEAQATWLAKYRQGTEAGLLHDDAAALANKAVRDTQGSGSAVNLTGLQSVEGLGGAALKLFNIFASFENTATNRAWTMIRRGQRGVEQLKRSAGVPNGRGFSGFQDRGLAGFRRDFLHNLSDLMAYFVLSAAVVGGVESATGTTGGKKFVHRFWEHLTQGAIGGTVPFGNELVGAFKAWETHGRDVGQDAPIASIIKSVFATGANVFDKLEGKSLADNRWVTHAIETVGYATGKPLKPVARAGQFAWDKSHGRTPEGVLNDIRGAFFGRQSGDGSTPTESHHQ